MANETNKDFNAMLKDSKDMPKLQILTDEKSIKKYGGDRMYFAPPIAYDEVMRAENKTPYRRTLKANGELNPKYPGGVAAQKEMLEKEGHTVVQKGRTNIRYYVQNYEQALFDLE